MQGTALGLFAADSQLRGSLWALVRSPAFGNVVFIVILLTCVGLVYKPDEGTAAAAIVDGVDYACLLFFTAEVCVKLLVFGLIVQRHAYFRSGWNVLDLLIVLIGWGTRLWPRAVLMRALRGLRAFRLALRLPSVKVVIVALIDALPAVASSLALASLFLLIFAILSVNLFKGVFAHCALTLNATSTSTVAVAAVAAVAGLGREACLAANGTTWTHVSAQNFDNVRSSIFTLLRITSLSGWGKINGTEMSKNRQACIDRRHLKCHPIIQSNIGGLF